ncbi:hypothetical protein CCE01nite_25560 [Cellulomonas cellasea]|uniref:Uncharacterized protein n=1 Tax=Cellulomonas cellasea TaxID=43670 RepID=A0A4Y3KXN4_9CELL|nr:hypothetical protein CCE01nite_25560 [Cellulomonas cellasea]
MQVGAARARKGVQERDDRQGLTHVRPIGTRTRALERSAGRFPRRGPPRRRTGRVSVQVGTDGAPTHPSAVGPWTRIRRTARAPEHEETPMSKRGRKRRARKGSAANHGNRPNA